LNNMRFKKNFELERPDMNVFRSQKKLPVVVVLDNVRSGLNVGSVFRSADSFALEKIFLCGITAKPPEREILKSALGATQTVAWEYTESTFDVLIRLKNEGFRIIGIEQAEPSVLLSELAVFNDEKYALVFGNEVKGVNAELIPLIDYCLEIPQSGTKHSLNISVCAGIVFWEFFKKY